MMEDHHSVNTLDKPVSGTKNIPRNEETCLVKATKGQADSVIYAEGESPAFVQKLVLEQDIQPIKVHSETQYLLTDIKEEPASCEEGNVTDTNLYNAPDDTQTEYTPGNVEECLKGKVSPKDRLLDSRKPKRGKYPEADVVPATINTDLIPHYSFSKGNSASSDLGKALCSVYDLRRGTRRGKEELSSGSAEDLTPTSAHKTQKVHMEEQPFPCPECGEGFTDEVALKKHHLLSCMECGKCFTRPSHLANHRMSHTGERPFKCAECGKYFPKASDLAVHKRIHDVRLKRFNCSECGKGFTRPSHLKNHKMVHTGEKPLKCTVCGKRFRVGSNLAQHKLIHTGEKPFKCSECGKCFTQASNLATHRKIHTGEKPFTCTECGKCFLRYASHESHKIIHTGNKPFKCTECGKCFTKASSLAEHRMIHTGEKPFTCTECGKSFLSSASLKSHKIVHTGHKPFKCTECGKAFSTHYRLKLHRSIHSGK